MYYIINRETDKLELHFSKEEYQTLGDAEKSKIKSNFLFSKRFSCWVSRAKRPNLSRAEQVAKDLGAEYQGKTGESLSFEEKMERAADRAESRADRMEAKAAAAQSRGEALQKPINDVHGDIAFFTQPNINTSAGRAFTRQRERMFAAYDRGMEEFKKTEYYAERAAIARETADLTKSKDKSFCDRRVKDAEKNIRAIQKNLESYRTRLEKIQHGEPQKFYDGTPIPTETVERWIEDAEDRLESEISRLCYYQSCIDALGGVQFSRENVKPGYRVKLARLGICEVVSTGPKNIVYQILSGGAEGFTGRAAYAEILEVTSSEEKAKPTHPFKVSETFQFDAFKLGQPDPVKETWEIVKTTKTSVTLRNQSTGEIVRRTPKIVHSYDGDEWKLEVLYRYDCCIYRKI